MFQEILSLTSTDRVATTSANDNIATTWPRAAANDDARSTRLFDLDLAHANRAEMADELLRRARRGTRTTVNFVNAHCVNTMMADDHYARILRRSDLILPDGSGMRIAAKLAGREMGDNLNGTDLFPEICARAAEQRQPIFLLGGEQGVANATADEMCRRYPGLEIAGVAHGFFSDDETETLIDRINASGARILLVALGVPRQEKWVAQHSTALRVPVVMSVGGLFDYYSGRIARAPMAVRRIGCEWAWRLYQEPRRLASRYLLGNTAFLLRAGRHALEARGIASGFSEVLKRQLDLAVGIFTIAIFAPIFAAVALAIKLEDGGPVFFRQTRIGREGKPFMMLKFRSMVVSAERQREALLAHSERDSTCFKMRRDPRITRVGAVLRRLSLDELPQLLNVAQGTMSLVGPRPALPSEVITYEGRSWGRLGGKPGITCTWQVSGRAEIPFERQVEMDIDYLAGAGIWQDLKLLAMTVPAVIGGRGAY